MDVQQREWKTLELEREGPILRVWLNRPERRNALNGVALQEIAELFGALQTDFETRVVVLGGRGPSFCAGADRKDPPGIDVRTSGEPGPRERRWASQLGRRATDAILDVEAVTLARVQGYAVGGGCVLAAACDFRIATEDAIFHVPEVDLGVPLTWGATPRLIQEIGSARARELILLCDPIDGLRAENWGLAHRAVPAAQLDAAVDQWVSRLLDKPEVAVHMTKTQMRAYSARESLGDVTETDGDVLTAALRGEVARQSFGSGPKSGESGD